MYLHIQSGHNSLIWCKSKKDFVNHTILKTLNAFMQFSFFAAKMFFFDYARTFFREYLRKRTFRQGKK